MWIRSRDDVATKPKHHIQTTKFMWTIFWSPLGFPVVDTPATCAKMDSDCFIAHVLAQLKPGMFLDGRRPHAKRLTFHLDNCSVHTSGVSEVYLAEHSMIRLKHPPYSPDLAPSDFYLVPTVKERLKDIEMVDEEDLLNRLKEILNEIPRKGLDKVFRTWINWLMMVSGGDGGYIS
jgi:histone-lysine N-methyltransferase SETMAR